MALKDKVDIGAKLDPLSVGVVRNGCHLTVGCAVQSLNTNNIARM